MIHDDVQNRQSRSDTLPAHESTSDDQQEELARHHHNAAATGIRRQAPVRPPDSELMIAIGEIFFLVSHSELHMRQPVFLIERRFIHPLSIGQVRMFHGTNNVPIGCVSWAWLSDDVDRAMMDDPDALRPGDWQSGDHLWFIEFIAPFGRVREMVRFLDDEVFGTVERPALGRAKSYKIDPKGGEPKLRYLYPRRVKTEPNGVLL